MSEGSGHAKKRAKKFGKKQTNVRICNYSNYSDPGSVKHDFVHLL